MLRTPDTAQGGPDADQRRASGLSRTLRCAPPCATDKLKRLGEARRPRRLGVRRAVPKHD